MVEQNKMSNKTKGRPNNQNNYSNAVRSIIFTVVLICFAAFLITNMNYGAVQKTEVPISEVIQRANDPNGDIEKITVIGNSLDITLKGEKQPTQTSRKDGAGTLYDQGLVDYCDDYEPDINDIADAYDPYEDLTPSEYNYYRFEN